MAKKPDCNDALSMISTQTAIEDLVKFVNCIPIETKCAWRELSIVRNRIDARATWLKVRDKQFIADWARKNVMVEPGCKYLIERYRT